MTPNENYFLELVQELKTISEELETGDNWEDTTEPNGFVDESFNEMWEGR